MRNIIVSSGKIGSAVAARLATRGHAVSMMVRKPEANPELEKLGISFVVADAAVPKTLAKAFEGKDTFLFVSPLVENMVDLADSLIVAAGNAGVRYIVRSSARGASVHAPTIMGKLHGEVEKRIKESGIIYTILQPASFFQNILGSSPTIQSQHAFYGSSGTGKNAFVDVDDIAAVAAAAITQGTLHFGNTYEVTGSQLLNNDDLAAEISLLTGRNIKYVDLSPEDLGNTYLNYGMSAWGAKALLELENLARLGKLASTSDDVEKVTGKKPLTFRKFVQANLSAF